MGEYKLISITNSSKPNKKLMAKFKNKKTGRESVTHFGARGMDDYTKTKDTSLFSLCRMCFLTFIEK